MGSGTVHGDLWGARARDWAELHEHLHMPLYEAVFDAAGVDGRTRLLDIGCGSGVAAEVAVKRGATVTGIDAAPSMIDHARRMGPVRHVRGGRLRGVQVRHGDLHLGHVFQRPSVRRRCGSRTGARGSHRRAERCHRGHHLGRS